MKYDGYTQCKYCGNYDIPEAERQRKTSWGGWMTDDSMYCNGIRSWGINPYDEEIHNDASLKFQCDGQRYIDSREI